jgi:uncharacterized membrane protein
MIHGAIWAAPGGFGSDRELFMLMGVTFGTIMWFNVWFIIWPNQQKVLGLTPADDAAKKIAARTAGLASRVNTMLSIPMLYGMAAGSHGVF